MFGSILSLSSTDTVMGIAVSVIVTLMFILFYHRIFAVTFDEEFAVATGTNVGLFNILIAILTSVTVVIGMRIMGTLLVSSLIIFPPLSAIRLCDTFKVVTIASAIISVVSFILGLTLSYILSFPTGATVVVTNLTVMLCCFIFKVFKDKIKRKK